MREELAKYQNNQPCPACEGTRLRTEARCVKIGDGENARPIYEISNQPLRDALGYFLTLRLEGAKHEIADKVIKEITARLSFLNNVGLDYLSLDRSADTLSGGEAQRIRLASQIGSGLTGVMYVLDEPSIGLHQRDNDRLIKTLKHLRDLGNSVIVVEHDEDMIMASDHVVDMGPGAGEHGGVVVAEGTPAQIKSNPASMTGQYLSGERSIALPARRHAPGERRLTIVEAYGNNLKHVTLDLPVGLLTCVTGVSGSGKSTLINDTLYHAVAHHLYGSSAEPAPYESIDGLEHFDKVINVDQSPIGPHAALESRDLHGPVHADPRALCGRAVREGTRLRGRALLVQRQGRPLRSLPGRRGAQVEMHFLPTSTCRATYATASGTTARRWKSSTRARTSAKCST